MKSRSDLKNAEVGLALSRGYAAVLGRGAVASYHLTQLKYLGDLPAWEGLSFRADPEHVVAVNDRQPSRDTLFPSLPKCVDGILTDIRSIRCVFVAVVPTEKSVPVKTVAKLSPVLRSQSCVFVRLHAQTPEGERLLPRGDSVL